MIEMKNITKSFGGIKALSNVNFKIDFNDIHALIGENGAGKSTLVKILTGNLKADSGEIFLYGEKIDIHSQEEAIKLGIVMIHQELNIIPAMSVMENIWLNREKSSLGVIDFKRMKTETQSILDDLQLDINPEDTLKNFSMAECQLVEIAKAISYKPKILIMDEPTSSLSIKEIEVLFKIMKRLHKLGTTVIYISHRMDEIQQICNKLTVLRNGVFIGTRELKDLTMSEIVHMMIGDNVQNIKKVEFPYSKSISPILQVQNLSLKNRLFDISLSLNRGEILGLAGLMGSGRSELVECIYGLRKKDSGEIKIRGSQEDISSPQKALQHKIALIPEDRKNVGLIMKLSPCYNTTLSNLDHCISHGIINKTIEYDTLLHYQQLLQIKLGLFSSPISSLSGGNQQKVVIAKNIFADPDILIFDEPTRGVDVKSKIEICNIIVSLAEQGKAIIFISSELEEVIKISTRILVMRHGCICAEKKTSETTYSEILALSMGDIGG